MCVRAQKFCGNGDADDLAKKGPVKHFKVSEPRLVYPMGMFRKPESKYMEY
jgi:hypothetical protein